MKIIHSLSKIIKYAAGGVCIVLGSCAVQSSSHWASDWHSEILKEFYLSEAIKKFDLSPLSCNGGCDRNVRVVDASSWGNIVFTISVKLGSADLEGMYSSPEAGNKIFRFDKILNASESQKINRILQSLDMDNLNNKSIFEGGETVAVDVGELLIESVDNNGYFYVIRTGSSSVEYEANIRELLKFLYEFMPHATGNRD